MANYPRQRDSVSIVDDALEKLTYEAMKEVMNNYAKITHVQPAIAEVEKCIELGVSKIISPWIPDRYTEVDVQAWVGDTYSTIVAEFMTDGDTMMVVAHDMKTPNNENRISSKDYNPTSRVETYDCFNNKGGRGSKVETLPGGQGLGELSDIEYFKQRIYEATGLTPQMMEPEVAETNHLGIVDKPYIDWSEMSSVNMDSALAPFDAKGTSGWSYEYTITTSAADDDNPIWVAGDDEDGRFRITTTNGNTWVAIDDDGNIDVSSKYDIEFELDEVLNLDLDEVADLINEVQSEVMKFE